MLNGEQMRRILARQKKAFRADLVEREGEELSRATSLSIVETRIIPESHRSD